MRLEIYAEETRRLASELGGVLAQVRQLLQAQHTLSKLEQSGALHAIQVLTKAWAALVPQSWPKLK